MRTRRNVTIENGRKIFNGDTWTVDSVTEDKKIVLRPAVKATSGRLLTVGDNGNIVGERLCVAVDETFYKSYIELAYCTTTDTSQGAEGDRSILVTETDAMALSRLNTAATRGKAAPIYMVRSTLVCCHTRLRVRQSRL